MIHKYKSMVVVELCCLLPFQGGCCAAMLATTQQGKWEIMGKKKCC